MDKTKSHREIREAQAKWMSWLRLREQGDTGYVVGDLVEANDAYLMVGPLPFGKGEEEQRKALNQRTSGKSHQMCLRRLVEVDPEDRV